MSITNVDRIGGFVVGSASNYNASAFGKSIFFAPDTKQLLVDNVKYIPKNLSELVNDANYLTSSALNTWQGTSNITTLGTITSGVWNGTPIVNDYLANSSISIAGVSVALGGRINSSTLKEKLGLDDGPYLPLAGGTMTGLLQTDNKVQFNTITSTTLIDVYNNDNGSTYPILSFDAGNENVTIGHDNVYQLLFNASSLVEFLPNAMFNNDVQIDGTLNCTLDAHVDGNLTTLGVLKVGGATLSWDEANQCLMVDKGIASHSFVSAGGIEESSTIAELRQRVAQLEAQLISLTNKE